MDNLVDLLMKEALAFVSPEMRARVQKVSHGLGPGGFHLGLVPYNIFQVVSSSQCSLTSLA